MGACGGYVVELDGIGSVSSFKFSFKFPLRSSLSLQVPNKQTNKTYICKIYKKNV